MDSIQKSDPQSTILTFMHELEFYTFWIFRTLSGTKESRVRYALIIIIIIIIRLHVLFFVVGKL